MVVRMARLSCVLSLRVSCSSIAQEQCCLSHVEERHCTAGIALASKQEGCELHEGNSTYEDKIVKVRFGRWCCLLSSYYWMKNSSSQAHHCALSSFSLLLWFPDSVLEPWIAFEAFWQVLITRPIVGKGWDFATNFPLQYIMAGGWLICSTLSVHTFNNILYMIIIFISCLSYRAEAARRL